MTVSIRRVLLGGLVAAIGLAPGAAPAQDGDNEPLVIVPLEDADGEADGAGPPPAPATPDLDLEVETLEAVSAETAGTLDTKSGGFGHDMWRGSDGALVALVMPEIRGGAGSRVMTNLARRLLLTAGSAPEGDAGDLLGARIGRLVAIGRQDDVPGLIDSAGLRALTAAGHRGRIEALLLDGDNDAACQAARDALATGDDDTIALTLVFCQRLAGRHAAAELGLAVLRDAGAPVGERYLALDRGLARGRPVPLDSLEGVSPLLFAMTLATGAGLSPDRFAAAPAPILRAASMREALPLEVRLHAAETRRGRGRDGRRGARRSLWPDAVQRRRDRPCARARRRPRGPLRPGPALPGRRPPRPAGGQGRGPLGHAAPCGGRGRKGRLHRRRAHHRRGDREADARRPASPGFRATRRWRFWRAACPNTRRAGGPCWRTGRATTPWRRRRSLPSGPSTASPSASSFPTTARACSGGGTPARGSTPGASPPRRSFTWRSSRRSTIGWPRP